MSDSMKVPLFAKCHSNTERSSKAKGPLETATCDETTREKSPKGSSSCVTSGSACAADSRKETVRSPKDADILIGRGKPFQNHAGNKHMRGLVEQHKDRYNSADRDMRKLVALDVLDMLTARGSRFLKRPFRKANISSNVDDGWEVASRDEACEKLCHALRSKPPRKRKSPQAAIAPAARRSRASVSHESSPILNDQLCVLPGDRRQVQDRRNNVPMDHLSVRSVSTLSEEATLAELRRLTALLGMPQSPTLGREATLIASLRGRIAHSLFGTGPSGSQMIGRQQQVVEYSTRPLDSRIPFEGAMFGLYQALRHDNVSISRERSSTADTRTTLNHLLLGELLNGSPLPGTADR
jgi:hypothetical protein